MLRFDGLMMPIHGTECSGRQNDQPLLGSAAYFASALRQCSNRKALSAGQCIHLQISQSGLDRKTYFGNLLVHMYCKCGSMEQALAAFASIEQRDVVSWTTLIAGFATNGRAVEALGLYWKMNLEGVRPDMVTFASIVGACSKSGALAEGKAIHSCIFSSGFDSYVVVQNALLDMYAKCGCLDEAKRLFEKMCEKDVISWTAMLAAYAQNGHGAEALKLYRIMDLEGMKPNMFSFASILSACCLVGALAEGKAIHARILASGCKSDVVVGTALVNMYAKCESLEHARTVFENMPRKNVVSWNSMIAAYAQGGLGADAILLYKEMCSENVEPDVFTLTSIIDVCSELGDLAEGKAVHVRFLVRKMLSDAVSNALVNMYAKCGSLDDATRAFEKTHKKNVVAWTSMITGYAQHGRGDEALHLFRQMILEGMHPDKVSFTGILHACSHAGLLNEALNCFMSMVEDYATTPSIEQYRCVIDLLGRSGRTNVAEELIKSMPFQPEAVTWMTLLGACKLHVDPERGTWAAGEILQLDAKNSAPYVWLSSMYKLLLPSTRSMFIHS